MFSHNTQGGLFTTANVLDKNSEDPNADLFSILGQLHYLKINEHFNFRLCYPELKGINGGSCNDWSQSSNPATNSSIHGFKANKPLAFTENSYKKDWKGLGKNSQSVIRDPRVTFIDDAPTQSYWCSAIGAFSYWPQKPYIPGPRLEPNPAKRSAITKVDLSVYNEAKELSLTTKGYNYQYNPFFCFLSVKPPATTKEPTTTEVPTTTKEPVNGNWGPWGSWASCNTETGTKTRSRSCNKPAPENGGSLCPGPSSSTDKCKTQTTNN